MDVSQSGVGIVVATFGTPRWEHWATRRAMPTAEAQTYRDRQGAWKFVRVCQVHGGETLAEARNAGAKEILDYVDHLIFLDGDDELAPGYVQAMLDAEPTRAELLVPSVQYVRNGRKRPPKFWNEVDYHDGNWLVIGTMIPVEAFSEAHGFQEYGMYEDWAFFAALQERGYVARKVPDAVYIAHQEPRGRNNAGHSEKLYWHQRVGHDLWPDRYEAVTADELERQRLASRHVRRLEPVDA